LQVSPDTYAGFEFDEISVGVEFICEDPCQRDYLNIWCLPDDLKGSSIIDILILLIGSLFEFLSISVVLELLPGPWGWWKISLMNPRSPFFNTCGKGAVVGG
jgi:hypothetical protein